MPSLHWFRDDLRIHDNVALLPSFSSEVVHAIYVFDSVASGKTSFEFEKTGRHRRRFLAQSLITLGEKLARMGIYLTVVPGDLAEQIAAFVAQHPIDQLTYQKGWGTEELEAEAKVNTFAKANQIQVKSAEGYTMLSPSSLPFSIAQLPELFTEFRKGVERNGLKVAPVLKPPIRGAQPISWSPESVLATLGVSEADLQETTRFPGGETMGLSRLKEYFWEGDHLKVYKETRNGMLQFDDSSKFSPWLSTGGLSARLVYSQVKRYEQERTANDSTYWLIFELLWRDFFRFSLMKHGRQLFVRDGLQNLALPWKQDRRLFEAWKNGQTGFPLVDANMRELAETGYMSNRGRQIVASFLTKNLALDWRLGAEWFESQLLDYEVGSNYGNWQYAAGIGQDARGFRLFDLDRQAKQYDSDGQYTRRWVPELAHLSTQFVHQPWRYASLETADEPALDYPARIVDFERTAKENRRIYERQAGIA